MNKEVEKLLEKAYETGILTNDEALYVLTNMFIWEDEYILDTGSVYQANAEMILRLKGKEVYLHDIFWKKL